MQSPAPRADGPHCRSAGSGPAALPAGPASRPAGWRFLPSASGADAPAVRSAPDAVAITNGCTEALSLALRTLTTRGDTVAIETPTYFGLLRVLQGLGLKALELPTDADEGVNVEALERALVSKPVIACLFSSGFNNPLGCAMSEEKKRSILAILQAHSVPLIEDDIYGDIYFGPARPKPFMALDPDADVIYCSSFSKTLAPGYRVGWIATQRHMEAALEAKFALTLCGAALPQAALAEFLAT
ncbi:MAG TPA: PLP-dependent aminotransferase family protein, partial [Hyphomicrobiales bacterium]